MKYTITFRGHVINVEVKNGVGHISSNLHTHECEDDEYYNAGMDALESLILAHACAGVDIMAPSYVEGLSGAVEACANNL